MIKFFIVQILLLVLFCDGQSQDLPCDGGKTCIDRDSCESFTSEQAKLKQLRKGTSEYRYFFEVKNNISIKSFSIGHYWHNWESLFVTRKGKKFAAEKGSLYQAEAAVRMIPQALVICQIP